MKLIKYTLLALCASMLLLTSCSKNKSKRKDSTTYSETTGWKYNDPKYGGFELRSAKKQKVGPGLVYIEGSFFIMGQAGEDVTYEYNNRTRRVTVDSYFIDETEVRNRDYREYLHWLQKVYASFPEEHQNALPDTLVWRQPLAYNEPYVQTYLRHPAYNDYPVVGVSWLQANWYCSWRTDRVNELMLIEAGVLKLDFSNQADENNFNTEAYLAGQYEGTVKKNLRDYSSTDKKATRPVNFSDGILLPEYRLPTEAEWEYAAVAPIGITYDERQLDRRMYPWDGTNVRNPYKRDRGRMMANFQRGKGDLMGVTGSLNDGGAIPQPVRSYAPNDFGLFCMAGNVNEWVMDVYRTESHMDVEEFRPFRGNVFTEMRKNEDGSAVEKDEKGRMQKDTIGLDLKRYNYQIGDNRNYRDGDVLSSIEYEKNKDTDPETRANSTRMYYQGAGEKQAGMTSLITDKSRVYKGGSFLDRAYWLSPATRRFLDQERAAVDIGFRCAMNELGSNGQTKGKRK